MVEKIEEKKWYRKLKKSKLNPPPYVFGIVWPILYVILIIYFIQGINQKNSTKAMIYFSIQMLFNLSWTYIFFGKKKLIIGLISLFIMIIFTFLSMREMYYINKTLSYLLIPYILWLLFASYLSFYIVANNKIIN